MQKYDLEQAEQQAQLIAYEVSKIFGDGEGGEQNADAFNTGAEVW